MKPSFLRSAKELTRAAIFVALVLSVQVALSSVPGVELVTLLFVAYSYVFGAKRGTFAATAFTLVRQIVFGIWIKVLVLYLVYFNFLCVVFGILGKRRAKLWLVVPIACVCTALFTVFDDILTPLYYGYTMKAAKTYFLASLPFAIPQIVCTFFSVGLLFSPLTKIFFALKKSFRT